jgi:hypothetical protein
MKIVENPVVPDALQRLVTEFENDPTLLDPRHLRQRLEALDRLDAHLTFAFSAVSPSDSIEPELHRRATAICARLEAANGELYAAIRSEIRRASRPGALLRWVHLSEDISPPASEVARIPANGMGYDHLDDLLCGVLQLEEPGAAPDPQNQEMVSYQPTPVRHILHLLRVTELSAADVLIDLGSGLGHVPLLVSICTQARCIGVELEAAYIERARQCAHRLNLNNVTFLRQDAREADLSSGTVFYLYTPFLGSILAAVLGRLHREAATRPIRICSYGPITPAIAQEHWLRAAAIPQTDRITLFRSRD